jgi:hypothetical protein
MKFQQPLPITIFHKLNRRTEIPYLAYQVLSQNSIPLLPSSMVYYTILGPIRYYIKFQQPLPIKLFHKLNRRTEIPYLAYQVLSQNSILLLLSSMVYYTLIFPIR